MVIVGAGESVTLAGSGVRSPSPRLLFSLGAALPVWLALLSLSPFSTIPSLASPLGLSDFCGLGARQVGSSQTTPVKLFNWNGLRSHRRHGVPLRSRARRPALMAPWLALGPSLCVVGASLVVSTVPSSLKSIQSAVGPYRATGKSHTVWASFSDPACLLAWAPDRRSG